MLDVEHGVLVCRSLCVNGRVGMANITLDPDYLHDRHIVGRDKPRHAAEGLAHGVRDLSIGIFKGITGIVVCTLQGGERGNAGQLTPFL